MLVFNVPARDVRAWRDTVRSDIQRAEKYLGGRSDADDILDLCENDYMLLWIVVDLDDNYQAAIVTQVQDYPKLRCLTLVACGGTNMKKWLSIANVIIRDYAKKKGCTIWEIWARPAWIRVLSKYSARQSLVVLEGPV